MSVVTPLSDFSYARREDHLAAYAVRSDQSQERRYTEDPHPYRGPFERDRDRILHSAAFRRLSGKMQVFTGEMGDYHRTRLTHSFEVSSIARTMGRALRLNEDLIEALALFHDIGHPPFGHAGEEALNRCLEDCGGFSHNQHALTIAEELEDRHRPYPGLNLTFAVLAGQSSRVDKSSTEFTTLEAQVVDAADSLAYDAHDVDDALKLRLVRLDDFLEVPLVYDAILSAREQFGTDSAHSEALRKWVVHRLLDSQVTETLSRFSEALSQSEGTEELKFDPTTPGRRQLEEFLFHRVYRHPDVIRQRQTAMEQVERLFQYLTTQPHQLPGRFVQRCESQGVRQAVGEYVACMTDRYCSAQYARLTGGRSSR